MSGLGTKRSGEGSRDAVPQLATYQPAPAAGETADNIHSRPAMPQQLHTCNFLTESDVQTMSPSDLMGVYVHSPPIPLNTDKPLTCIQPQLLNQYLKHQPMTFYDNNLMSPPAGGWHVEIDTANTLRQCVMVEGRLRVQLAFDGSIPRYVYG